MTMFRVRYLGRQVFAASKLFAVQFRCQSSDSCATSRADVSGLWRINSPLRWPVWPNRKPVSSEIAKNGLKLLFSKVASKLDDDVLCSLPGEAGICCIETLLTSSFVRRNVNQTLSQLDSLANTG